MDILFIHQAFPAQFGKLAVELKRTRGWTSSFLFEDLATCPTPEPEMLSEIRLIKLPDVAELKDKKPIPWPQIHARYLVLCAAIRETLSKTPGLKPDLIVAHGGRGAPTLLLEEVFDCPILIYCEYYFQRSRADISYRIDLPPAEPAEFFPRTINAATLLSLMKASGGYSATHFQKRSFPKRFHSMIEVHFDGIDTKLYQPVRARPRKLKDWLIPEDTRVVTYIARGLESIRGFDVFMRVARKIQLSRSDVLFVVVGTENIFYGWDKLHTSSESFKQWTLSQVEVDLSRFVFIDFLEPDKLAEIFNISDLHFYLTAPFVLSWSLIDALSCGCVVLAADAEPVCEVIENGVNGLVEPFFDVDRLAEAALRVLDDPEAYQPMAKAARETVLERYSLEACIPKLGDYFERVANGYARSPSESDD